MLEASTRNTTHLIEALIEALIDALIDAPIERLSDALMDAAIDSDLDSTADGFAPCIESGPNVFTWLPCLYSCDIMLVRYLMPTKCFPIHDVYSGELTISQVYSHLHSQSIAEDPKCIGHLLRSSLPHRLYHRERKCL